MIATKKLLVTTAIEQTWGDDEQIVFLGEWCRLYDRKDVWSKRQYQLIRNHWDDRRKLKCDHDYLKSFHESLLEDIAHALNKYHQIDRSLRYWRMILDPWLVNYVAIIFDRWEYLRMVFDEYGQLETMAMDNLSHPLPAFDGDSFLLASVEDLWNYQLFLEIIKSTYSKQCKIHKLSLPSFYNASDNGSLVVKQEAFSLRRKSIEFLDFLLGKLTSKNQVVFFSSYFPIVSFIKLNFNLKQCPRFYLKEFKWPPQLSEMPVLGDLGRERVGISLHRKAANGFEKFLIGRLNKDMPYTYLEGFSALLDRASQIPVKPKAILTANGHWSNEIFKLWAAEKVREGVKFIAMEHGGSIPPAFNVMSFEEDISEIKTTWAIPHHQKHLRLPPNKIGTGKIKSSREYCAVIGHEEPRYAYRANAAPIAGQILISFEMVCNLYSLLNSEIKTFFRIKPYYNWGWNTRQRYIDRLGANRVSNEKNYSRLLSSARVVVCTYPQTTFSEAMASGLPTILLYHAFLWETIPELDQMIKTLIEAKIIFTQPQDAADHLNAIWTDPDVWWNSSIVLYARKEFHQQALNLDSDWLGQWTAFIKEVAGE